MVSLSRCAKSWTWNYPATGPAVSPRTAAQFADQAHDTRRATIIALSPASQRRALELTRFYHLTVEYWPILDPTGLGETRDAKIAQYRAARDQIKDRLIDRFGPPSRPQI